jgi:hypothetical protein
MKTLKLALTFLTILFLTALMPIDNKAQTAVGGHLYTVNDPGDSHDANAGDGICLDAAGKCTLRAAIEENNAIGFNVVNFTLPPAAVIDLTLGELLITKQIKVVGPSAKNLTIRRSPAAGTPQFRVFHIAPNAGLRFSMRGFRIKNGSVAGDGGGILIEIGNVVFMTDVAISDSIANRGGALANAGTLTLTRALFTMNSVNTAGNDSPFGGAIINLESALSLTISNATFTQNTAASGGAIYNLGGLLLVNNTLAGNAASNSGSSIFSASGGTVSVFNTIIGMDTAPAAASSLSGAFTSLGNNLVTDARNGTGFSNGVNGDQVSDNNAIDPLLGALADNGGQTETRALLPGSAAIDHANNCIFFGNCADPLPTRIRLSTDQRGYSRISNAAVDIGAFESGSSVSSASGGFLLISIRPRLAGSLLILTRASDGTKQYRTANSSGGYSFGNLGQDAYILEIRSKRAGLSSVAVLEFDIFPFVPLTGGIFGQDEMQITFGK